MIQLDSPYFENADVIKSRLTECIDSTWVGYQGKYSNDLSRALCDLYNSRYAIPVSSGTHALYMAVACLDIPVGSEVIVPTMCYSGNIVAITMNNLVPKFVDCDVDSPNTTSQLILDAVSSDTKAIMIPHMYGKLIDLSLLQSSNLKIIEDTTQTLINWQGSTADITCISFHNKIITSGEGGAVLVNDEHLYNKMCKLWVPSQNNDDETLFMSGRLSNVSCAIALSQIETLDTIINRRNNVATQYNIQLNQNMHYDVCWRYQYKCSDPKSLVEYLNSNDIQSRQVFCPMHHKFTDKSFPNAEKYFNTHIDLPSGPAITPEQIESVCATITQYEKLK